MNILNKRFRGRGGAEEKNMKGKGIRSAIAASALSAVLCAGMLAGTTFAWFTDTVSSTGNSIMAGNLDITATKAELDTSADAQYTFTNRDDETETYALAFGAAEEFDGEAIIAETAFAPGMWNAKLLTVTNAGDLAVYVKLNFVTQDEGLADALWFDFIGVNGESVTGELTHREMSTLEGFGSDMEIPLAADESVSYILIYGMDKEAGNTYQGMNFNVDAYILARQQTEGATYPWDGQSTEEVTPEGDTYPVEKPEQFAWVVDEINGGTSFEGKTIELTADIDLNDMPWEPIDASAGQLRNAVIDGNGHTVSNMNVVDRTVTSGGMPYGAGFIGNINTGVTIRDISFDSAYVEVTDGLYLGNIVGIVMGYANGDTVFENVRVTNSTVYGYGKAGILVGMGNVGCNITFRNCVSEGNTIRAQYDAGGLAGMIQRNNGTDTTVVENCAVDNTFEFIAWEGESCIELVGQEVAYTDDDLATGSPVPRTIDATVVEMDGYYWIVYGELYCSYGKSSYDARITTEGEHFNKPIANSEYPVDVQ